MSDHWQYDHLEQQRQLQALQEQQAEVARQLARDEMARQEAARLQSAQLAAKQDEQRVLQKETVVCLGCGVPIGRQGLCQSCSEPDSGVDKSVWRSDQLYQEPLTKPDRTAGGETPFPMSSGRSTAGETRPSMAPEPAYMPPPQPTTESTRESTSWVAESQDRRGRGAPEPVPSRERQSKGERSHPGQRKDADVLRDFLTPRESGGPMAPVQASAPPATREDLREALVSSLHHVVDQDLPKFYCVNCSTHVVTPGTCASCGEMLRRTGEVADMFWDAFQPELHFVDPAFAIDMRDVAGYNQDATSLGYPRDSRAFWWVMLAEHPHLFSEDNVDRINRRQSPEVDTQWLDYHPGQELYLHDRLVHHHWDQGPWAFGVPEHFHTQFHKLLHPL
jgi:hypothetical protein